MKTQLISHDQLVEMKGVTKNQLEVFKQYAEGKNLFLYGPAGTGKTFVILYNAIKQVLDPSTDFNCIYIVRSLMPTRSLAFMPGDEQDKSSLYQVPYDNMLRLMFKLSSEEQFEMMYEELKKQGNVAFLSTSFLRGITLDNAIILVDECQNLNFHELDTIMTRVGQSSKIMFSGDFDQTDLREDDEKAGLGQFIKIINEMKEFYSCEFDIGDIVRSGLVRSYIIQKYNTGLGDRK
jgi:phosphate starvation-inducible PhoH-like protein/PhoH-like ATPase